MYTQIIGIVIDGHVEHTEIMLPNAPLFEQFDIFNSHWLGFVIDHGNICLIYASDHIIVCFGVSVCV